VDRLLPDAPRRYRTTVVSNADTGSYEVTERVTEAGATVQSVRPLGLRYPGDVFSLSHIALPFPEDDPVYGGAPDLAEDFGVHLGAVVLRGERGTLVVSLDALGRTSWNPFFPYQGSASRRGFPPVPDGGTAECRQTPRGCGCVATTTTGKGVGPPQHGGSCRGENLTILGEKAYLDAAGRLWRTGAPV